MATIDGTSGDDGLAGTSGADTIDGLGGDDIIVGGAGDDTLIGGSGSDNFIFVAGDGSDVVTDFSAGDRISIYGEGPLSVSSLTVSDDGLNVIAHFSNGEQITFLNVDLSTVESGFDPYLGSPPVIGTVGDDSIVATGNTESVFGAGGDDVIDGRPSAVLQRVDGGSGNDTIYAGAVVDLVVNGDADNDNIFSGSETHGGDGNDTITIGDVVSEFFFVDGDAGDDVITGGVANDDLSGGDGADKISGGDGNDSLFSGGNGVDADRGDNGFEHDTLYGDAGNDVLFIGYGDDADGGVGTDWLNANFSASPTGIVLNSASIGSGLLIGGGTIENFERVQSLTGSEFADSFVLTGQAYSSIYARGGNDSVTASGDGIYVQGDDGDDFISVTGNNVELHGGNGNDTILVNGANAGVRGEAGDDIIGSAGLGGYFWGDEGTNTIDYTASSTGVTVNLATSTGAGGDHLFNFANIKGSTFADSLTGDTGSNVLDGGAGNDTMVGGTGDDTYYVDSSGDVVTEATSAGTDTVHSTISYTLGANLENAVADGAAAINLTGNTLANVLTGNSAANILDGGTGADKLTGGAGVDTFVYRTGGGADVITDFAAGEAIDVYGFSAAKSVVQSGSNVVVTLATGSTITVDNATVANVNAALHFMGSGGGGTPGTIIGTANADTLNGTSGNDTINGLGGNDTLNGNGGNDTLDGGAGADIMKGGAGNDIYFVDNTGDRVTELSGAGTDEVRTTITQTLATNVEKGTALGTAAINLTGNTLANTLTGNSAANTLNGGAGNDTLKGGLGNDVLTGGTGADVFLYSDVSSGADRITDFVSGADKINLHALGITAAQVHTAVSGSNLVIGVDADHNGTNDFTITLTGVTHISASDYIF